MRDAAWVVHCAGAVRGASRRAFDAVNVDGTAALLDAMAAAAPKARLLHVSTLAAAQPQLSDYAASKRSAELLVTTRGQSGDLILRPTAVYGPGDKELKPLLDQAMRGRLPRPVGSRRISLLHIDDLVDALVLAMGTTPGRPAPTPSPMHELKVTVGAKSPRQPSAFGAIRFASSPCPKPCFISFPWGNPQRKGPGR